MLFSPPINLPMSITNDRQPHALSMLGPERLWLGTHESCFRLFFDDFFYFYTKSGVSIIWSDRPTSLMNVLCMLKRVCMTIQMSIIEDMCTNGFQRTGGLYIRGALLDDGPMRLAFWYSEMVRLYHQRFVYYVL